MTYRAYDPEEIETAEVGLKSEFLDRHVRLNLAAYRTIYKNQQIDFNARLSAVPGGPTRTTIETVNAEGNGTIKGFEADLTIAPVTGLTLTAAYAYTKGDLEKAINPFNPSAPPQNVFLVYTPRNAFSGAVDYSLPLSGATLRAHVDANGGDGYLAIVLSGGPMLDGWHEGELVGSGTVIWRSCRKLAAGEIDEEEFLQRACESAPCAGHCNTIGTASTMNAVAEALGLS